jgi:acyl-CoA thioesterase-1
MNPVLLYFTSGESLYCGALLLLLIVAISLFLAHRWLLRFRNLVTWLALTMIVMACPPFPWFVDTTFLAAFLLWFIASNRLASPQKLRIPATAILVVLLLALPAMEFSHRRMPVIAGTASDHLVVIGDSISSGLDPRVPPWPTVMEQMTGVQVNNLAQPGATVIEGLAMAAKVTPQDRVVLIEIGGNDLIAGVSSATFGRGLEEIVAKIASPGRVIAMFELPLLPNKIAYGQSQRRIAAKYGVSLIPKRYLTGVIGGASATSDGLHLSSSGTRQMAALVAQVFSGILKSPPILKSITH